MSYVENLRRSLNKYYFSFVYLFLISAKQTLNSTHKYVEKVLHPLRRVSTSKYTHLPYTLQLTTHGLWAGVINSGISSF